MLFKVWYDNKKITLGPQIIEAVSEEDARQAFAGSAFSGDEMTEIQIQSVGLEDSIKFFKGKKHG